jgi:hypothetical protein
MEVSRQQDSLQLLNTFPATSGFLTPSAWALHLLQWLGRSVWARASL